MNDVLPERAWFETAEVVHRALKDEDPENPVNP